MTMAKQQNGRAFGAPRRFVDELLNVPQYFQPAIRTAKNFERTFVPRDASQPTYVLKYNVPYEVIPMPYDALKQYYDIIEDQLATGDASKILRRYYLPAYQRFSLLPWFREAGSIRQLQVDAFGTVGTIYSGNENTIYQETQYVPSPERFAKYLAYNLYWHVYTVHIELQGKKIPMSPAFVLLPVDRKETLFIPDAYGFFAMFNEGLEDTIPEDKRGAVWLALYRAVYHNDEAMAPIHPGQASPWAWGLSASVWWHFFTEEVVPWIETHKEAIENILTPLRALLGIHLVHVLPYTEVETPDGKAVVEPGKLVYGDDRVYACPSVYTELPSYVLETLRNKPILYWL